MHQSKSQSESTFEAPTFESLGLAEPLVRGLTKNGFLNATEIQARSIPVALQGRDVLASAQTGTGKTAAFVLPAMEKLLTPALKEGRGPRVLILTPTRELAGQVETVISQMARFTRLKSGTVVGGMSYSPQERMLRNGVDLLVATPGRLMDHMERRLLDFSRLEMFVLDEADRMLDMGFINPVRKISAALPKNRQTLLFSATLEGQVMTVAKQLLNNPERIHLSPARSRNESITQHMHMARDPEHKHALLNHFLSDSEVNQAIVFTATKRGADRLAKRLNEKGHACASLHGNMRQNARDKTVESLRRGHVRVLVATDVAARGIDVLGVSHVFNFDLPTVAEDYIHRIGRTGRNGASGTAISLVGHQDRVKLSKIERLTGHSMERLSVTDLHAVTMPAPNPRGGNSGGNSDGGSRSEYNGNSSRPQRRSEERPFQPRRKRPSNGRSYGESAPNGNRKSADSSGQPSGNSNASDAPRPSRSNFRPGRKPRSNQGGGNGGGGNGGGRMRSAS